MNTKTNKWLLVILCSCLLLNNCTPTPPAGCSDTITGTSLQTNLIAYYKFPSSGAQLNDYSGNNFHLTNTGSVAADLNRSGSANCAMRFNGNNYLETTMPSGLSYVSGQAFTLALSFKPDAPPFANGAFKILVAQLQASVVVSPSILLGAAWTFTAPSLRIDSSKNIVANVGAYLHSPGVSMISNNDWHTAIFSWDGVNQVSLTDYNSATAVTTTQTATVTPIAACTAGSCPTHTVIGYGFIGVIDDIKIWSRILTATEILTIKTYDSPCCP